MNLEIQKERRGVYIKPKQTGGGVDKKITGTAVRGVISGLKEGLSYVPGGKFIMKGINPVLSKGEKELAEWESGKTKFQRDEEARLKKERPLIEARQSAERKRLASLPKKVYKKSDWLIANEQAAKQNVGPKRAVRHPAEYF